MKIQDKLFHYFYFLIDKIENSSYKTEYKYISQRFDWDCGIASVSMFLKQDYIKTYKEIKKFKRINKKLGVSFESIIEYVKISCKICRKKQLLKDFNYKNECILLLNNVNRKNGSHYIFYYDKIIYDPEEGRYFIEKYKRYNQIIGAIYFNSPCKD